VTPLLRELHWLRVPERITFQLASLVFRCLNGTAPVYLADSINCAADVGTRWSLRSSSSTAVVVPVTRRSMIGDRAFPVAAARAWNSLPLFVTSSSSLSTFKRHLKTYLLASCKLGADPGSPYLLSLCANTQVWPAISQMSIHAQFILLTWGDTGYLSQVWPDLNLDFFQWGGESVPVPELVEPVGGAMSDYSSIWKDLVAHLRLLSH